MTKFDKTQFAQFLTANGFEVEVTDLGIVHGTAETARGTLEVFAAENDRPNEGGRVHAYKPNGKRSDYWEVSNAQANARVRQLLKANATAWR